ncbi:hypothetical protein [Streptomyces fuscigenes]|uniref:hypothetical protein n=1 Tax=Streptomyces fuscigenes TaxID=1528880 RepID=UPI001F34189C|nr:hypothetical protein [Streptomyces fuscigenes]MCF3960891.1 hypothetical protein [Streptomyces fuscigenes]
MVHRRSTTVAGVLLAGSAAAFVVGPAAGAADPPGAARAATGPSTVASALKGGPVYVDPRASDQLSGSQANAIASKIKDADKPLFVAVLPNNSDFPPDSVLRTVRTDTGITGLYAIRLGSGFNAGADSSVLSRQAVSNLTAAAKSGGPVSANTQLNNFVDQALPQLRGHAPASWHGNSAGGPGSGTALAVLGAVVVAGTAGVYVVSRRNRNRRATQEREALESLRVVVDEDITAFGEELDRLDFRPGEEGADDAMRGDYERGLDAYETAKRRMAAARHPEDVRAVTSALEDGRFALASLEARRKGEALPQRRPPCFFDPRHGPSVRDEEWTPSGGVPRAVPVCAADAARIEDGEDPQARTVDTVYGRRPYWEAGPVYGPWAGGYFGGGLLPGLLFGTLLGSALTGPAYAADPGGAGDVGGDVSGSDFDPGDFGGGGFGDGGGGFGDGGGGGGGFGGGDGGFGL